MAGPWEKKYASPALDRAAPWEKVYAQQEPTRVQRVGQWLRGENREEEIPTMELRVPGLFQSREVGLQLDKAQAAQMTALLATTASDDRLKSGIKKILPDAQFEADEFGNLVVVTPVTGSAETSKQWTRFYPNPRGLDMVDVMQGAGAMAAGEVIAPLAGLLGLGGSATAMATGATEAALVEKASSGLSDAEFKWGDIPWGAGGGLLGVKAGQQIEKILPALLGGRAIVQVVDASGQLTAEGRAIVEAAGIDPSAVTAEMAANIQSSVNRGLNPEQSAALAEAKTLPKPVPLTRGQVTGDKGQQLFEDAALKGSLGQEPADIMRGRALVQQEALQENIPAIQQYIAGRADPISRQQGGTQAQQTLSQMRTAEKAASEEAYRAARAGGTASFKEPDFAADAADRIRAAVREEINLTVAPKASLVLDGIDEVLAGRGDVRTLFELRQQLNTVGQRGSVEQTAASIARKELDAVLVDALNEDLLVGNTEVISLWKDAIKKYRDFKTMWDENGILKGLTEEVTRDGDKVLKVAPEEAARHIFGTSSNGMVSRANLTRDLKTLQRTLPEADWNSLQQEAFLLLMDQASKRADELSGGTLFSAWGKLKRENPALVNQLFDAEQQALISQYVAVAQRVSGRAQNASNSATTAASILGSLFKSFGQTRAAQTATQSFILKSFAGMVARGRAGAVGMSSPQAAQTAFGAASAGTGGAAITSDQPAEAIGQQIERTTGFQVR